MKKSLQTLSPMIAEKQTGIAKKEAQGIANYYRSLGGHSIELVERNYFDCDITVTKQASGDIQGNYRRVNR